MQQYRKSLLGLALVSLRRYLPKWLALLLTAQAVPLLMRFWKPLVQTMQSVSTSLRRPARLMCWCMIKVMAKINSTISLLSNLYYSRFSRVLNNPDNSIGMLNVNEGVVLVDNRSKILQKQTVLQIQNARFVPAFLSSNTRTVFLFKNMSPAFLNNARSASSARPAFNLPQNVRLAFCLFHNRTPVFLILNAKSALWTYWNNTGGPRFNTTRGSHFNKETRDSHSEWHVFKT